jgi:hypothetical protein
LFVGITVPTAPGKAIEKLIEDAPPAEAVVVVINAPTVPGTAGEKPVTLEYHLTVELAAAPVIPKADIPDRNVPLQTAFAVTAIGATGLSTISIYLSILTLLASGEP